MTNSRDLNNQAQAVLQAAVEESEAKFLELVATLKDEQPPCSDLTKDIEFFRRTATQLRAILANQSAHSEQIEMPLDEAGQDADATDGEAADGEATGAPIPSFAEFNASKRHYQDRILALRQEVESHAASIEALEQRLANSVKSQQRQQALLQERELRISELSAAVESNKLQQEESAASPEAAEEAEARIAALEEELRAEREHADNLNELANSRAEDITRITEQYEEAQERYEEAKWELGKAKRFEKILKRRKKLIADLISTIRAKQKSNLALKAGLDGLRSYKARADEKQQELLRRIDSLENSLSQARERIAASKHDQRGEDDVANLKHEVSTLKEKAESQVAVIEQLETDLRNARAAAKDRDKKEGEIERLNESIETKNTFIGTLQREFDEQQKNAAKLRKARLELRQLREAGEVDQKHIDALTRENEELRKSKSQAESGQAQSHSESADTIQRMGESIKEYEKTIATLSEAVEHWKRKYDFLAAETPFGYEPVSKS